ncbi:MAG: FmdB family zinc ribbon protein, partial [Candidatus Methylomirabilales bacterium]
NLVPGGAVPIYEYLCLSCGQVFEKLIFNRAAQVECPRCPGAPVERMLSIFSFKAEGRFVGSQGGCSACRTPSA